MFALIRRVNPDTDDSVWRPRCVCHGQSQWRDICMVSVNGTTRYFKEEPAGTRTATGWRLTHVKCKTDDLAVWLTRGCDGLYSGTCSPPEPWPSAGQDYLASLSCLATIRISLAPLLSSKLARSTPSRSALSWASPQILLAVTPTRWTCSSTSSRHCYMRSIWLDCGWIWSDTKDVQTEKPIRSCALLPCQKQRCSSALSPSDFLIHPGCKLPPSSRAAKTQHQTMCPSTSTEREGS